MNNSQLNVTCSPGTFMRIQKDQVYRQQLASQVLENREDYNEVIFSTQLMGEVHEAQSGVCTEEAQNPVEALEMQSSQRSEEELPSEGMFGSAEKQAWVEAPVKLMLALIEELRPKVGKSASVKNKTKIWKIITERMAAEGYNFSTAQIENKFRTMERNFKRTNLHNKQTGRNRQTCPYQNELEKVLGEQRGINPDFVLDNEELEGIARNAGPPPESSSDVDPSTNDDVPSCAPKRRKVASNERTYQKLEEMARERKEYHSKVLVLLEKKEQRAQRKEEMAQRKEEMAQKKLELLEALVKQNKP
ncbi:PREDICTED: uncharacterized protein LOC108374612 [Rhagoletis zephyria]|uniref:uncharacterized protein LOC108374612 n=1 Tax=Rhagoletis zephyria TaxID=28612 RepID=UPI00081170AF|nr:PREDICTED: uncharacterized protein LOC108374612 [Rhagoletis zephyria]